MVEHAHVHGPGGRHPIAVLVQLSGAQRGTTARLTGEFITLGTSPDADLSFEIPHSVEPGTIHAALVSRGTAYKIVAEPGRCVWVNGIEVQRRELKSEDLVEVARGGPVFRFRVYPPGSPGYKTVWEAFGDCVECARMSDASMLRRAGALASGLPKELLTQTSRVFRTGVAIALAVLAVSTTMLVRRSVTLEDRLAEELARVAGLSDLLTEAARQTLTPEDLDALRVEFEARLGETAGRIGELEARGGAVARVVSEAGGSTLFIQGAYAFSEARTGRFLRLMLDGRGRPRRNIRGEPALTLTGDGPVFEVPYTGTGFVINTDEGLVMTNRHVALPWEFDEAAGGILSQGYTGVMRRLRAFIPGVPNALDLTFLSASDAADVAILEAAGLPEATPSLDFAEAPPEPGTEVVVLGYPLGIRALVARSDPSFLIGLEQAGETGFWEVAERLGLAGEITPLASRGIVGQVSDNAVVYDAETTSGGSGGPVLDLSGRVIAVNAAILPQFGGSNLGVPADRGRALVEALRR